MSSIRLSGSTSGYYDLTVPAVAGTNSIDLSNLVTDNHTGNLTLTGNLGIGTTSPVKPLHVDGGGDYNMILRSASNRSGLAIHHPGTGGLGSPLGSALVLESDDTFRLGTQSVYNIIMDQSGRVTMPNQPGWHGTHSDNYATTYSGGTVHNMTTGHNNEYNSGNHFDYSTNRFTVPVTGYYLLYGWDIRDSARTSTGLAIGAWKNGVGGGNRLVSNYHQYDRAYAFSTIAYLAVNDWVSFGCTEGGGVPGLFYGTAGYSGYGIRLLG